MHPRLLWHVVFYISISIDGHALGYDYVENMHDKRDQVQANVIASLHIMKAML
jgi:hypothetical protein